MKKRRNELRVAIVYDRVNKWGGAERVLLTLHEMFPEAPLITSLYDSQKASWAKIFPEVIPSFLQQIPLLPKKHEYLGTFMPIAFESFDFSGFDVVISVTSEAAKGIKTRPGTLHICYCLTPTRYLWSHYNDYFKGRTFKVIAKPLVKCLRKWDAEASKRPDIMIAISNEVKKRIKKYYLRDSEIIFPPVNTSLLYKQSLASQSPGSNEVGERKYYLIISRLVRYKKIDLAITSFNKLGSPLVIAGTGRDEKRLRAMAQKNIKFMGKVSDKKLANIYLGAKALIMPQEEDFGIAAVEAQSMGVPVIAYKRGGAIDTVIPGKTGIFFEEQKPESLTQAMKRFEKMEFLVDNLHINAKRFSKRVFKNKIRKLISKYSKI